MAIKLIVLDRDGVINNDLERPVRTPDEWVPIEGSLEAIARLYQAGWSVAVATNQSGISRGLIELTTLHDIHQRMHEQVNQVGGKIDVVAFCPHTDSDDCGCRKPAPGMLYTISERLGIELTNVVMVGDSLRDMQAAMAAAATPIIVRTGKGQKTLDNHKGLEHIPAFDDLASYVDHLLTPTETD
ncbi:MAG: D-glycero-beta-D-manno-heptose 1,7-bisphosphate 7-phosphatase [Granulosicoccus sp.]